MSDLKNTDRIKLERMFEMKSGYVCDFSDRRFGDFVLEETGIDVYAPGYEANGTSKANRLRNFWQIESNYLSAKLISEMLEYWKSQKLSGASGAYVEGEEYNQGLHDECLKIVESLKKSVPVENMDALAIEHNDNNFSVLRESIEDSIKRGKPDLAVDRLHTFVVKYVRSLCDKHSIGYAKDTPLHSLFGAYVKILEKACLIESEMTLRILKTSISWLDSFNGVRNNQSLAHDNQILNYNESVLIANNILSILKFIQVIEKNLDSNKKVEDEPVIRVEDIPF